MMKSCMRMCIFVSFILLTSRKGVSQETVHALTGSVISIDMSNGKLALFEDGGSKAIFKMPSPKSRIALDKKIAEDTAALDASLKQGAYIVAFYIGRDDNQTAVAIKDLGAGPFSAVTGEVVKWNGHDHSLSVVDKNGAEQTFVTNLQTIEETPMGVINGSKINLGKGDRVRLVSSTRNGVSTVLFISQK